MDVPNEKTADDQAQRADTPRRRHRWWQFGLRGLLLLVIAVGLLACRQYLKPYWRQQQTIALIERLGGTCQTAEAGPWWQKIKHLSQLDPLFLVQTQVTDAGLEHLTGLTSSRCYRSAARALRPPVSLS